MGMFKKKRDPFSERAKHLQKQIAQLEEEIQRLSSSREDAEPASPTPPSYHTPAQPNSPPQPPVPRPLAESSAIPPISNQEPRLRSTAHPHGPTVLNPQNPLPPSSAGPTLDPIFEEVRQNPFRSQAVVSQHKEQALGIRQNDFASFWQRLKNHFRGPVTSNPKLVNYLAAGSIQGLRPLRYERRIARNRFIVLVVILVMILWGILALLLRR